MIPYDTDPSLHAHVPGDSMLDDGFSPPAAGGPEPLLHDGTEPSGSETPQPADCAFWDKSDF